MKQKQFRTLRIGYCLSPFLNINKLYIYSSTTSCGLTKKWRRRRLLVIAAGSLARRAAKKKTSRRVPAGIQEQPMHQPLDATLTFAQAADIWVQSRTTAPGSHARYVSPRTLHDIHQYIRALERKFGETPLNEIHIGLIREYQMKRAETCGPNKINQEVSTLQRIMKRARAWTPDHEECYERLQHVEADIPRAMTPDEQKKFLDVASSREEWQLVYWYSLVAVATTATNCEMRGLHIGDVNLYSKVIQIRREHAKNRHRIRTIPMHDE